MSVVRIIHVSDLHLFVDAEGNHRSYKERAWTARAMASLGSFMEYLPSSWMRDHAGQLFSGLDTHSDTALKAMLHTIDELLAEDVPQVVVQTGDMSTFGALTAADEVLFPEWQYWRDNVRSPRESRTQCWIDLFGNHDVWPGTLPAVALDNITRVMQSLRDTFFPHKMPIVHHIRVGRLDLQLVAINSVLFEVGRNTLAQGALVPDVVDATAPPDEPADPLDRVVCALERARPVGERVVRALLMHHPPHHFQKPNSSSSEGGLLDAERLGKWLEHRRNTFPFQLVFAGHRHCVHPPREATTSPDQKPLPRCTLQLVCGSPTQEPRATKKATHLRKKSDVIPLRSTAEDQPHATSRPSFSVYELHEADEGGGVQLTRTVYEHRAKTAHKFEAVAAGSFHLPLAGGHQEDRQCV